MAMTPMGNNITPLNFVMLANPITPPNKTSCAAFCVEGWVSQWQMPHNPTLLRAITKPSLLTEVLMNKNMGLKATNDAVSMGRVDVSFEGALGGLVMLFAMR